MGSIDLTGSRKKVQSAKQDKAETRNVPVFEDTEEIAVRIIQDEAGKIIQHLETRLPADALKALDIKNGLKLKIGGIIEKNFREMSTLCPTADAGGDAGFWAAASRNDFALFANI
jgi:hypothetical protein